MEMHEKCTDCNKSISSEEYIKNGGYCEKCMNNTKKFDYIVGTIIIIVITLIIGLVGNSVGAWGSSSRKSKWDSLTKEEQEWYERNYGGGKSDDYDRAIDNYKNK